MQERSLRLQIVRSEIGRGFILTVTGESFVEALRITKLEWGTLEIYFLLYLLNLDSFFLSSCFQSQCPNNLVLELWPLKKDDQNIATTWLGGKLSHYYVESHRINGVEYNMLSQLAQCRYHLEMKPPPKIEEELESPPIQPMRFLSKCDTNNELKSSSKCTC